MFICLQVLQELCRLVYGFTVKMSSKGDDDAVDEMCDDLEDEICRAPFHSPIDYDDAMPCILIVCQVPDAVFEEQQAQVIPAYLLKFTIWSFFLRRISDLVCFAWFKS